MDKKYLIYKITNVKNGKMYVGQTKRGLKERWSQHVYNAVNHVSDSHFKRAIRKWGADAFVAEILIDNLSLEDANRYEELFVELLGTFESGYNSTRGGDNHEMTEEVLKKMSEAFKGENNPMYGRRGENCPWYGRTHSQESRQKMSESRRGDKNYMYGRRGEKSPMYGRTLSLETKQKISKAMRGRTLSKETKQKLSDAKTKTSIIAIDKITGEPLSFKSIVEAGRILGASNGNISTAAKKNRDLSPITGTTYSRGSWYIYYRETYSNPNCQMHIGEIDLNSQRKTKTPVIGVCKNTKEVRRFSSTCEVSRVLGIHNSSVSIAVRRNRDLRPTTGTTYSAGEYYFFYPEQYEQYKKFF